MRKFLLFVLIAFYSFTASAQSRIQRAPVAADYIDFLTHADSRCDSCSLLLTIRDERPHISQLAYVRAKLAKKDDQPEIQAAYFKLNQPNAANGAPTDKFSVNDYS